MRCSRSGPGTHPPEHPCWAGAWWRGARLALAGSSLRARTRTRGDGGFAHGAVRGWARTFSGDERTHQNQRARLLDGTRPTRPSIAVCSRWRSTVDHAGRGSSNAHTREFLDALWADRAVRPTAVVYTHSHWDHVLGGAELVSWLSLMWRRPKPCLSSPQGTGATKGSRGAWPPVSPHASTLRP